MPRPSPPLASFPASAAYPAANPAAAYRMLWRWHFYAGLFVMPFLTVLAITGTLYCFQPQIEPLLYPQLLRVTPAGERLPAQTLLERARAAAPAGAAVTTYTVSHHPRSSAEFVVRLPSGGSESLYLNPYTGEILGHLSVEGRLMKQVRMLHRALLLGKPGELLMELASCWALVMIATGLAMWWPRWRAKGPAALVIGKSTGKRGWWKEIHLVMGSWLAVGAVAFVLSGLPWTASWGQQFKALATKADLGRPTMTAPTGHGAAAHGVHGSHEAGHKAGHEAGHKAGHKAGHEAGHGVTMEQLPLAEIPWATGLARVPTAGGSGNGTPIGLDRVVAVLAEGGPTAGCQIVLPGAASSVYTASCFPADPKAERTVHLHPGDGHVIRQIRYDDYGPVAKAISYGTSLHMGRYFGVLNQIACAAISLGLMALAVTGAVMWWKRRPARALAAPAYPPRLPPMRAWILGLGLLGAVFPMMGATLLAVWLLDRGFARMAGIPAERDAAA